MKDEELEVYNEVLSILRALEDRLRRVERGVDILIVMVIVIGGLLFFH